MSIEEKLLGTSWELVCYQSEDKDGDVLYPLGEDAKGVIIFTVNSQLSVHITAADRENKVTEEKLERYNTEAEKQMARIGYHGYSGPFNLDEEKNILTTHVKISVLSDYIGSDQNRSAKLDGDYLHLSNVQHPERKLVWKKIK